MRVLQTQSGFTLIETIFFLAISSLMVVTAMTMISGRTQEVQFTDSIRSVESFFESKISQIRSGSVTLPNENCRWNGTDYTSNPSDGSCIFLGYMFRFSGPDSTSIDTYQMFGARIDTDATTLCSTPEEPLSCVRPITIPDRPVDTFEIPWSIQAVQSRKINVDVPIFGYLRDPNGTDLIPVGIIAGNESRINDPSLYLVDSSRSYVGDEYSVKVCLTDGSRRASLKLGDYDRQFAIEAKFNDLSCPAP